MKNMEIRITQLRDSGTGGTWADGTVGPFTFQALVFKDHAASKSFELGRSRISKMQVKLRGPEFRPVFNFDRGMDIPAKTADAKNAVKLLTEQLAKLVFPKRAHI